MRMVIIAAVALLVVGGLGAGAYFYFMKPAEASQGAEVGKEAAKAEQAKKDEAAKAVEFVELDPLILPIVGEDGLTQVVSLVIALEVPDAARKEEVKKFSPRLKDAYIQDMYGMLNKQAALKGGIIQVGALKARLNEITIKVLGKDMVNDVLLQVVQQRPA